MSHIKRIYDLFKVDIRTMESRMKMNGAPDVNGLAALAIIESLMLALNDHDILPEREIMGVLKDAAAAHQNAPDDQISRQTHDAVAALITHIVNSGNSVRRP